MSMTTMPSGASGGAAYLMPRRPTAGEMDAIVARSGRATVVPTGLAELDEWTGGGLHIGQLTVVAAVPGVGRSTLGLGFLRACSIEHRMPGVLFSPTMIRDEAMMRILAAEAGVRLRPIRAGGMTDADRAAIARSVNGITSAPLFIDDTPDQTLPQIWRTARRLTQDHDLKLIVVDELALVSPDDARGSVDEKIAEVTRSLKVLAQELQVAVVAVVHLDQGCGEHPDNRPSVADLPGDGSVERDADTIVLIHRPDRWDNDDPRAGEADLILGKHRNGLTATITVAHQLHLARFKHMPRG